MLKIKSITSVWDALYDGVVYPVIDVLVCIDDSEVPETLSFGPEALGTALCPDGTPVSRCAREVDEEIYAYVPDDLHTRSHQEITSWIELEID